MLLIEEIVEIGDVLIGDASGMMPIYLFLQKILRFHLGMKRDMLQKLTFLQMRKRLI